MIDANLFKTLVKTTVLLQSTLEAMDDVKGTNIYKHSLKNKIKNLEKSIEQTINDKVVALDMTDSNLFDEIKSKVDVILDMTLEEIGGLKLAVEENRANALEINETEKSKKSRPGVHAKTRNSGTKTSKNYRKKYRGQGR